MDLNPGTYDVWTSTLGHMTIAYNHYLTHVLLEHYGMLVYVLARDACLCLGKGVSVYFLQGSVFWEDVYVCMKRRLRISFNFSRMHSPCT